MSPRNDPACAFYAALALCAASPDCAESDRNRPRRDCPPLALHADASHAPMRKRVRSCEPPHRQPGSTQPCWEPSFRTGRLCALSKQICPPSSICAARMRICPLRSIFRAVRNQFCPPCLFYASCGSGTCPPCSRSMRNSSSRSVCPQSMWFCPPLSFFSLRNRTRLLYSLRMQFLPSCLTFAPSKSHPSSPQAFRFPERDPFPVSCGDAVDFFFSVIVPLRMNLYFKRRFVLGAASFLYYYTAKS